MNRTDIINGLIKARGFVSYVEIGVRNRRDNFDKIECEHKMGVDPRADGGEDMFRGFSDEFFEYLLTPPPNAHGVDLIFIDGNHSFTQSCWDVRNAFAVLSEHGIVVMHDCHPLNINAAAPQKPEGGAPWNGEVYRVFLKYRVYKSYLAYCVNCDHGLGIIERGAGQELIMPERWDFDKYRRNDRLWLGLVNPDSWHPSYNLLP